ncbi:MAG: TspO/MBR family protein [bacterium]|nr:TspO/MBR family protein [bacterium]
MTLGNIFKLIISIVVSELAGVIGALYTTPAIQSGWYAGLIKPAINPPAWVFGPAWTTLYALMGISLFLIWKEHSSILQNVRMFRIWKIGVAVFFIQLALNTLWSVIFFRLHLLGGAFIEIIFLWLAILVTIIAFAKISRPAAYLLLPYILWVAFAAYLNYSIWALNVL